MKKLIIAMLIVAMLAISLVSCGANNTNNNTNGNSKDTSKDTSMSAEDGKISDTTRRNNSFMDNVESDIAGLESDIMK